jgi:hypothetical protein
MDVNAVLSRSCKVCVVGGGRYNISMSFSRLEPKNFREECEACPFKLISWRTMFLEIMKHFEKNVFIDIT